MNESASKVAGLYKGLSYGDQYGTSIILTIVLLVSLFLTYAYFKSKINSQPIRDNWPKYRCNPDVIPFAGMINKPEGETVNSYTQKNFNYCLNEMVKPITEKAVNPLDYLMTGLMSVFSVISKSISNIRNMIKNMRSRLAKMVRNIYQRILKLIIPIQEMMIRTKDLFAKSIAILKVGLETAMGAYLTLKSSMGVMVSAGAWSLIIGAVVLVGLYGLFIAAILFFPWTLWYVVGAIATFTAAYITIMVMVLIIISFMRSVMEISPNLRVAPPPKKPARPSSCFDRHTVLQMEDGTQKTIADVVVGDVLCDGGRVTATFELDSFFQQMYTIDDVIVSGTHKIRHGGEWVFVKNHPDAREIDMREYADPRLYNLNTATKQIPVNSCVFCDWDEISDKEERILRNAIDVAAPILDGKDKSFIHEYFDGGFTKNALVDMVDDSQKRIQDVRIADKVRGGGVVYGIVKIDKNGLVETSHHLENPDETQLFHLLVQGTTSQFAVNGECVYDYNHYIDSVHS